MAHDENGHHGHHIIPFKVLTNVFLALVGLTVLTVLTAQGLDLGVLDVPLALTIASVKAALVITIFMALKYDKRVNALAFGMSGIFVIIFIVVTLFDTAFRGDMSNVDAMTVDELNRKTEQLEQRYMDGAVDPTVSGAPPTVEEAAEGETTVMEGGDADVVDEAAAAPDTTGQ